MQTCCSLPPKQHQEKEKKLLLVVLIINGLMFVIEFVSGWMGDSTALIADSLDMLADASVYAISLYAVGGHIVLKAKAALLNGGLQLLLGIGVLLDIGRRLWLGSAPEPMVMGFIGVMALLANTLCFWLLYHFRQGDINLRAAWICSRNDIIANLGVLLAALFVSLFNSAWPDYVIGALIAAIVIRSACHIINAARSEIKQESQ